MTKHMFEVIVRDGWNSDHEGNIFQKIKTCSHSLAIWGREITGNFSGRIKKCKEETKKLKGGRDGDSKDRYSEARKELTKILNQREIFWRQRSK